MAGVRELRPKVKEFSRRSLPSAVCLSVCLSAWGSGLSAATYNGAQFTVSDYQTELLRQHLEARLASKLAALSDRLAAAFCPHLAVNSRLGDFVKTLFEVFIGTGSGRNKLGY